VDLYVTAETLAATWKVDISTVYRWGRDGKILREVLGDRTVRFPRSVLDQPAPADDETQE
jgi:predicted site-specific integrase-resolvase